MPTDPERVYWDSVVFIDLLQETSGRIDAIQAVVKSAQAGEAVIVTSALTMVEVVKIKALGLLDSDTEALVAAFFENDYIQVRNLDRFVAEKARPLVREFNLKPADAVQVATAILMKVLVLQTYDEGLLKHDRKIDGLRIEIPGRASAADPKD